MNSQQLADRLAELAGWTKDHDGWWTHPGKPYETTNTIVKVGSLDALERWRGECVPDWNWYWFQPRCGDEWMVSIERGIDEGWADGSGPTEWDARAAALVAAKEQEMKK